MLFCYRLVVVDRESLSGIGIDVDVYRQNAIARERGHQYTR